MGWVMTFLMSWKGDHNFFDELKGGGLSGVFFALSFSKAVFSALNHVFRNNLVEVWQFLTKRGNEIEYLMPIKYKISLGNWALPPYNPCQGASPLNPCEHLDHRLTIQNGMTPVHSAQRGGAFLMTVGEKSHSGNLKLVEAWNLWWKWYKLRNHYKIMWILPSEKRAFLGF